MSNFKISMGFDVPEEAAKTFLQFVEVYLANNVGKKIVYSRDEEQKPTLKFEDRKIKVTDHKDGSYTVEYFD